VSLSGANGAADSVTGAYDTIALGNSQATLQGSHDIVYFSGASSLTVAGANDAFNFGAALGQASITGFASSDSIGLSKTDWTSFSALQASHDMTQSGADTIVRLDASDTLTLKSVQMSTLTASQFAFS